MSIDVRSFESLGRHDIDWLSARHHFSFGHYRDPARTRFGPLRVWNDDTIRAKTGFDPHPHRDMEIVTYVRKGAITHRDNLGNEGRTAAGDVQVMSAGTGIVHAEYNLEDEDTQLFQIWIEPDRDGHPPRWEMRQFPKDSAGLVALASGEAHVLAGGEALMIHRDATLYGATLAKGETVEHRLAPGRRAYLVPVRGAVAVNGTQVDARSGAAVEDVETLRIVAADATELVLADLP